MFVETQIRPQGEQQVGKMKLSEAIRAGSKKIDENRSFLGCAVCAACWGTGLEVTYHNYAGGREMFQHLSKTTTAPLNVIESISARHFGGETSKQLADWLEAQGL